MCCYSLEKTQMKSSQLWLNLSGFIKQVTEWKYSTVKPVYSEHFGTSLKCPDNQGFLFSRSIYM